MPRSLREVARLLLLAGGCTLPALLQAGSPAAPAPRPASGTLILISPDQLRGEAMRVELAWLSDPALYQLPLEVQVRDQILEVSGTVPDATVHQHVLRVARQSCYLPIHDVLTVTAPAVAPTPVALRQSACEVLRRSLGDRAAHMQVAASGAGQIVLRGEVATLDDKLIASRTLRGLPGCSGVVNSLCVRGDRTTTTTRETAGAAPLLRQVQATQAETVPGATPAVPTVQHAATAPYVVPSGTLTLPSGLPSVRYRVPTPPAGPQGINADRPSAPRLTVRERLTQGWRVPPLPSAAASPVPTETVQVVTPPIQPAGVQAERAMLTRPSVPPPIQPTRHPSTAGPSVQQSLRFYPSRPLARLVSEPRSLRQTPTSTPLPTPAGATNPLPTKDEWTVPVSTTTTTPVPAAPAALPAAVKAESAPAPTPTIQPAAATSVALTPQAGPPLTIKPVELQRLITTAAGKRIDRVHVETQGNQHVVHVQVRPGAQEELVPVLLGLPELSASNVRLHLHLAP